MQIDLGIRKKENNPYVRVEGYYLIRIKLILHIFSFDFFYWNFCEMLAENLKIIFATSVFCFIYSYMRVSRFLFRFYEQIQKYKTSVSLSLHFLAFQSSYASFKLSMCLDSMLPFKNGFYRVYSSSCDNFMCKF